MIPNTKIRENVDSGVQDSTSFDISVDDSAHIMNILRDTLYSDKVLAVLREYSANAWDAHRDAGRGDRPISVTLPTAMDPTLTIRDYGNGLSHDDIFNVFTKYGKSTKRGTDNAVGMLGIGSKSGFAYADTFTITTWHEGWRGVYAAVLDPSDKGELKLLDQGDAAGETGVQIQIAVRPNDIHEFHQKARGLFRWFNPRPQINFVLPEPTPGRPLTNGQIDNEDTDEWVAVMGCIAYRVNPDQLAGEPDFNRDLFNRISGALYFNIGDVMVNASREELKYSDGTKRALVAKFNALVDEYVSAVLDEVQADNITAWEKRLRVQVLNRLSMPLPKDDPLFSRNIAITTPPVSFSIQRNRSVASTVGINSSVRLLLQDDPRSLRGFNLGEHDYVVKPAPRTSLKVVEAELAVVLAQYNMTGVPAALLSTLPWTPYRRSGSNGSSGGVKNSKHRISAFKLKGALDRYHRPWSDNWDPETEREASQDDVYVILENFQPTGGYYRAESFYSDFAMVRGMAKAFNLAMPEVYGYKTTAAKPVKSAPGTEYNVWRKNFIAQLDKARARELVDAFDWAHALRYYDYRIEGKGVEKVKRSLGEGHPLHRFAMQVQEGKALVTASGFSDNVFHFLRSNVLGEQTDEKTVPRSAERQLLKTYKLLDNVADLWDNKYESWIEYVKLIDANNAQEA